MKAKDAFDIAKGGKTELSLQAGQVLTSVTDRQRLEQWLPSQIESCCSGIPFWGRCTTHVRTYFSGDWDVSLGCGILTHGQKGG